MFWTKIISFFTHHFAVHMLNEVEWSNPRRSKEKEEEKDSKTEGG
jgi:hypothetical protein